LTGGKLLAFRSTLIEEASSEYTFNRWLRPNKQMWAHWIDAEFCPVLKHKHVKAAKLLRVQARRRDFLNPPQLRKLLEATERHDLDNPPIGPFVLFILLTGMRRGEGVSLAFDQIDFEAPDSTGRKVGLIYLPPEKTKTKKQRDVYLSVSPALRQLLRAQHLLTGGTGSVFGFTAGQVDTAMDRLRDKYGAPRAFSYQSLRRTASSFLCNAQGVPCGGPYGASEQLGHDLVVMRDHYAGRVSIPADCTSLESAMGVEDIAARIAGSSTFSKKRTFKS
jgi:integrase